MLRRKVIWIRFCIVCHHQNAYSRHNDRIIYVSWVFPSIDKRRVSYKIFPLLKLRIFQPNLVKSEPCIVYASSKCHKLNSSAKECEVDMVNQNSLSHCLRLFNFAIECTAAECLIGGKTSVTCPCKKRLGWRNFKSKIESINCVEKNHYKFIALFTSIIFIEENRQTLSCDFLLFK